MQAYRVETTIAPDGSLTITHLPLPVGEAVEVIILLHERPTPPTASYSLRDSKAVYRQPFDPVAQDEWNLLQ